jgi:drug/metabolite transporter (DMT)-like permease
MGSTWMLVAGLCFALMSVVVKSLGHAFSGVELVFYRSLFGLLAIVAILFAQQGGAGVRNLLGDHIGLNIRRGIVGFIALASFFYALIELPMSVAVTLNYASPLFLALLMPWQLGERPGAAQYGSVALGFVGVALLLRPWEAQSGELFAGLVGLFSGVMAAFAYIHVRQLGRLGEPEWRTVFWFAAVAMTGGAGRGDRDRLACAGTRRCATPAGPGRPGHTGPARHDTGLSQGRHRGGGQLCLQHRGFQRYP